MNDDSPSMGSKGPSTGDSKEMAGCVDRRDFVSSASSVAMAAGLGASYGTLLLMAGRFLYPSGSNRAWFYVAAAAKIPPGGSLAYESPGGTQVVIARTPESAGSDPLTGEDFRALSSTCPHLGCRVHWEAQNHRFYCPCHNGAFDAEGNPIAGPPKDGNQRLPVYPLRVIEGILYIEMPAETMSTPESPRIAAELSNSPYPLSPRVEES